MANNHRPGNQMNMSFGEHASLAREYPEDGTKISHLGRIENHDLSLSGIGEFFRYTFPYRLRTIVAM
jgi:hypothetical protein